MSVIVLERKNSRSSSEGQSAEVQYIIKGASNETEAKEAMLIKHAADGYPGQNLGGIEGINLKSISTEITIEDLAGSSGQMIGSIRYYINPRTQFSSDSPELETDKIPSTWSFSTTGGTRHITQSLNTFAFPAGAPNFNGAIDYDGENIKGCDIVVPNLRLRITKIYEQGEFTLADAKTIARFTGKVNSQPFQGFEAGEILYLGTPQAEERIGKGNTRNWAITHEFEYQENKDNEVIGGITLTGTTPGWFYNWPLYKPDATNLALPKPIAVYSEQVYKTADLNDLPGF